ncbi:hypothetical protein ABK040_004884 [Willaertia magna]
MQYCNLGNSGLVVSKLCVGCMGFGSSKWQDYVMDEEESLKVLKRTWDLGYNFYDTANMYSNGESEKILGKFIKVNNISREEIVIATKVFLPVDKSGGQSFVGKFKAKPNTNGLSRKHIMEAVNDSLQRLQTDYIDLYIIHRWDNNTPIEETMETLHDLIKQGKIRYIGASSMYAWQFSKAQYIAEMKGWTKFISMQNLYNLLYREEEREMIPLCHDMGIGLTPWSPLSAGILAKAESVVNNNNSLEVKEEEKDANKQQFSGADLEIMKRVVEIAKKKNFIPIVGVTKAEKAEENLKALQIELTKEEIAYLEERYQPKKISGYLS